MSRCICAGLSNGTYIVIQLKGFNGKCERQPAMPPFDTPGVLLGPLRKNFVRETKRRKGGGAWSAVGAAKVQCCVQMVQQPSMLYAVRGTMRLEI